MPKKVLIISGSARKGGNSDTLCDEFFKGAKEAGNVVEKISLQDTEIGYCIGCYACKKNGVCFKSDDMAEVLDKMVEADVIVMATPVYFYSLNAQMKALIDRTLPRYQEIRNTDFYFIVTAAVGSTGAVQRTLECFRGFTDCLHAPKEKGVIYGTGAWQMGDIKSMPVLETAYKMGTQV